MEMSFRSVKVVDGFFAVFFVLFLLSGQFKAALGGLPDVTAVTFGVSLALFAIGVMRSGFPIGFSQGLFFLLSISFFSLFSTAINVGNEGEGFKLFRFIIVNGWAFLGCMFLCKDSRSFKLAIIVFLGISFIVSLSYASGTDVAESEGVFANYLAIGRLTAMSSILCGILFILSLNRSAKLLFLVLCLYFASLTLFTAARGPSFVLPIILLFLFGYHSSRRTCLKSFVLFVLLSTSASIVLYKYRLDYFDKLVMRAAMTGLDTSTTGRIDRLEKGVELWSSSPFFGNGPNSFPTYYGGGRDESPHNLVVEIGAEFGGIVLLIMAVFFVYVTHRLFFLLPDVTEDRFAINISFFNLVFWILQVPLMGIETGKFAAFFLGAGLHYIIKRRLPCISARLSSSSSGLLVNQ